MALEQDNTYYAALSPALVPRRTLAQDIDCDALVIGGGFAGLWAARALAARGHDVVVIERGRIGGGASGRNAGFVGPGYAERLDHIIARVGVEDARALWALSREGVEIVRRHLASIPGVRPVPGRLSVRRTDDETATFREAYRLHTHFDTPVEAWDAREVRDVLRSTHYFQALHFPEDFHLDPLALLLGLAADLDRAGGRIYEQTEAVSADLEGLRKHVVTSGGRVRAQHVILAGGQLTGRVLPAVSRAVQPVATMIGVTEPLGERLDRAIGFRGAVADTRRAGNYFRRLDDGRLLWGAGFAFGEPSRKGLEKRLSADLGSVFPDLAGVQVEHAWAGTMAYAVHRMPQIGPLLPGVWVSAAFGGHGLNTAAMAGELIASGITEGDDRWKLFAPFGVVWAGAGLGRGLARVGLFALGLRDRLAEGKAREQAARL